MEQQRFEHLPVQCSLYSGENGIESTLKCMQDQGWEQCGAVPGVLGGAGSVILFFKRPITSATGSYLTPIALMQEPQPDEEES